ncbi:phage tail length tape measure family protein [Thermomonas sp.]|uniref:phage tail length tape measure family protein n=1 Tax=Thermomonas sp. TaxID=1971895 RepID=UPI003D101A7B
MTEIKFGVRIVASGGKEAAAELGHVAQGAKQVDAAMRQSAVSAKQMQAALRQLPMQFTDIVTGLASGQRPLQVLLQQGGQLKDVFGGIGPAARALGGYVAGLINPFAVAAAAVAAFGIAVNEAQKRSEEFARSAIFSGNFAGNADQLRQLADQIDRIGGVSSGTADDAVNALASIGTVSGEAMRKASEASAQWASVTGGSVDEIAKKFAALQAEPLQALDKLNAAEHFLTEAQRERIRTLIDEGRQNEAAAESIKLYAGVTIERAQAMRGEISTLDTALGMLKDSASSGWKAFSESASGAIDRAIADIGALLPLLDKVQAAIPGGRQVALLSAAAKAAVSERQRRMIDAGIDAGFKVLDGSSAVDSPAAVAADAAVKALDSQLDRYASFAQRRQQVQERIDRDAAAATAAGLSGRAKVIREKGAALLAAMDKQNAEEQARRARKAGGSISASDTEAVARAQADARLALVKDELARAKTLLDEGYQDRLLSAADYYRQKAALDQRENAAEQERLRAQLDSLQRAQAKAKPGERERFAGEVVRVQAQLDILQRQAADIERKAQRATAKAELDSVDQQLSRAQTLLQAVEQSAQARVAIGLATEVEARRMVVEATRAQGEALARELIPQIERLLATVTDPVVLAQLQAALDKVRQMQAEGREKTAFDGLTQSVRDYAAKAADAFGSAREAATRAFQGIEEALTDLVVKGKADFRSLVVSILADLARLQLQKGLSKLLEIVFPTPQKNAVGGVYASPSLSAYSGGVYDSPRVFAFANGIGVFGEAGPEAIMPLKRGRDGKLGVVAQGGGGGSITVNVAVDASGQRDGVGGDARGLDLGRRIQAAVKAVLVDEQRPGGLLAGRV